MLIITNNIELILSLYWNVSGVSSYFVISKSYVCIMSESKAYNIKTRKFNKIFSIKSFVKYIERTVVNYDIKQLVNIFCLCHEFMFAGWNITE